MDSNAYFQSQSFSHLYRRKYDIVNIDFLTWAWREEVDEVSVKWISDPMKILLLVKSVLSKMESDVLVTAANAKLIPR